MNIYIIRHTRVGVRSDMFYGQTDVPLAESFDEEAKEVVSKLNGIHPDKVYSSPLTRCKRLAEKVVKSEKITFDNRLKEINFGDWEMKSWRDIKGITADNWYKDFVNEKSPNGESYVQLYERAINFFEDLKKQNFNTVFIFSHGGFIRASHSYFKNIKLGDTFKLDINYGSVSVFEILKGPPLLR